MSLGRLFSSRGFSLFELNASLAASVIIVSSSLALTNIGLTEVRDSRIRTEIREIRNELFAALTRKGTIEHMLDRPENSGSLNCIRSGGICNRTRLVLNVATPLQDVSGATIGSTPFLYVRGNRDASRRGFDESGQPCDGFDPDVVNPNCPFQAQVDWVPICLNPTCSLADMNLQMRIVTARVAPFHSRFISPALAAEIPLKMNMRRTCPELIGGYPSNQLTLARQPQEFYFLSNYTSRDGVIELTVPRGRRDVYLWLNSYESMIWRVNDPFNRVKRIFHSSYHDSTVELNGMEVSRGTERIDGNRAQRTLVDVVYRGLRTSGDSSALYESWPTARIDLPYFRSQIEAVAGFPLTRIQTTYIGTCFTP